MTTTAKLLWVDDEIDLLRSHILFLENKGYEVDTVTNGRDAIARCRNTSYDLVLLDENMVGLSGLQTLNYLKEADPSLPIVMVTKSEEEDIMDQAIGSKIADYLIKPVHPNQILLTLKKNIHRQDLVSAKVGTEYRERFGELTGKINDTLTAADWTEVYKQLVYWELELAEADSTMRELLTLQKSQANASFAKFIRKNYMEWMAGGSTPPLFSPDLFKRHIFPALDKKESLFFIVIDNLRYDQWRVLSNELSEYFTINEELYYSILPTATQYSRNAIFSGLMPNRIEQLFPELWIDEDSPEGKNVNEAPLIQTQMERFRRKESFTYNKVANSQSAERLLASFNSLLSHELNIIVVNFIDILSHAKTDSKMVRELAAHEAAYRGLVSSWFHHSSVKELFIRMAAADCKVMITTDHGSILVKRPVKIQSDKSINSNLRYKVGKNMTYPSKEVFEISDPGRAFLPSPNLSSSYIFATESDYFVYQNNFNNYASYYKETFQHGGISMEEMIVPFITMQPKQNRKQ